MNAADLDLLADKVATRLSALKAPVLTLAEAITYTKHESDSAFYRWCEKWGVSTVARGRYSRRWLDRAMEKESTQGRRRQPKQAGETAEREAA
jgi:hypothetical protein